MVYFLASPSNRGLLVMFRWWCLWTCRLVSFSLANICIQVVVLVSLLLISFFSFANTHVVWVNIWAGRLLFTGWYLCSSCRLPVVGASTSWHWLILTVQYIQLCNGTGALVGWSPYSNWLKLTVCSDCGAGVPVGWSPSSHFLILMFRWWCWPATSHWLILKFRWCWPATSHWLILMFRLWCLCTCWLASFFSLADTYVQIVAMLYLLAGTLLLIGWYFCSDCGAGAPVGLPSSSHWLILLFKWWC